MFTLRCKQPYNRPTILKYIKVLKLAVGFGQQSILRVRTKDLMALVVTTETPVDAVANHANHYNLILIPTIPPKPLRPYPKNGVIDF